MLFFLPSLRTLRGRKDRTFYKMIVRWYHNRSAQNNKKITFQMYLLDAVSEPGLHV